MLIDASLPDLQRLGHLWETSERHGIPLVALMTGDEEIGSLASRPFIEREARKARAVFNAEPGRVSGNVVTGRKGGLHFTFEVTGKAAHSGVNFTDGASAIGAYEPAAERRAVALPNAHPSVSRHDTQFVLLSCPVAFGNHGGSRRCSRG